MDFAVPANHRVKITANEKRHKYLDIARDLEKLCKVIAVVIGALGTILKGLVKGAKIV